MKIILVVVDKLPESISECKAVRLNLTLPGVNSKLCRIFCKFDINDTKTQLVSLKEITTKRCPNCPLVEEAKEVQE